MTSTTAAAGRAWPARSSSCCRPRWPCSPTPSPSWSRRRCCGRSASPSPPCPRTRGRCAGHRRRDADALGHPLLRAIIVVSVPISFFTSGFLAIYVLYATRELGLGPATIGLIFAAGGVGAVSGAMLARWAATSSASAWP